MSELLTMDPDDITCPSERCDCSSCTKTCETCGLRVGHLDGDGGGYDRDFGAWLCDECLHDWRQDQVEWDATVRHL